MVGVQRKGGGMGSEQAPRQEINTESYIRLLGGCGSHKSSISELHPYRLPLCSRSHDVMKAVCNVAKTTTQYRNTTGASRERSMALCVLL